MTPGVHQDRLARMLEFLGSMSAREGAAAYVCRDFTCQRPVTTPEELAAVIGGHPQPSHEGRT